MAQLNVVKEKIYTHEGATAKHINPELSLKRSVMACLLWESQFYESGKDISDRIAELIPKVKAETVANIALEARNKMKLRHVPLLLVREMSRYDSHKYLVADLLNDIIQRPDELTEMLSIYWKDGRQPISAQVKKGLAEAFTKFNEYQLAKYNRDKAIRLKDVLFLCHAKPKDESQAELWKRLINDALQVPDTWEVALSSGGNKKNHWERLLKERKLGILALLRNLRNMTSSDVNTDLIIDNLKNTNPTKALPFRFISAAKYAPQFEQYLEESMIKCLNTQDKLSGNTVFLIDVSGSMDDRISSRSEITRLEAACGVAMLLREICDKVDIYTFSMKLVQIPSRRGFALKDAIVTSQVHSGTPLGIAVESIYADKSRVFTNTSFSWFGWSDYSKIDYSGQNLRPDRLIVITDEQSANSVPDPIGTGYMINVGSYKNGVGYGAWTHIDGWSEAVVEYIRNFELS